MFTGLVEEIGSIKSIVKGENSAVINIKGSKVLEEVKLGDSIAVNGVCLTVTSFKNNEFSVDVMPETFRKSSLKYLKSGSAVNLERALALGERLGGHIVSGHIDGTGEIIKVFIEDNAIWIHIKAEGSLLKYIVNKGSIAIDGISLTVVEVNNDFFKVSIIPHTKEATTLQAKKVGDVVNLECDVIGKYVERLMLHFGAESSKSSESKITEEFLRAKGFM